MMDRRELAALAESRRHMGNSAAELDLARGVRDLLAENDKLRELLEEACDLFDELEQPPQRPITLRFAAIRKEAGL